MTDDHRDDEPSALTFELPDLTPREVACSGGCGLTKTVGGPYFWCPTCRAREDAADADREERANLGDALASIPTEWAEATIGLADLPSRLIAPEGKRRAILRAARELDVTAHPMITIASADGTASGIGKTTIACVLFRRWLATRSIPLSERKLGRFVSAPTVPRMTPAAFAEVIQLPAIVLDDVGGEGTNPTARDAVSQVLRERQAWHRFTIVTTWMAEPALRDIYGAGIARRLFERGELIAW